MKFKNNAIYFLLFFLFLILLILNYIDPLLLWDENVYLANARSHISSSNFIEDFRFPLLEYIIAAVWFLVGESILAAKLVIILISIASVYIVYLISKEYFNTKKAFFCALLLSFSPLIISWGFKVYTDIPAMFFMSLSYYLLIKRIENIEFLAGIVLGLSFLTKFSFALFGIAVFIGFIIKKKFKELLLFFAGFFVALVPWMVYNYIHYSNIIWDLVIQWSVIKTYTSLEPVSKQVINLLSIIGFLIIFIPSGINSMIKEKKGDSIILILTILFLFYYLIIVKAKIIRYYFSILPFLYIIIYFGIIELSKRRNKTLFKGIINMTICASVIFSLIQPITGIARRGYCSKEGATLKAIDYIEINKDKYTSIISNIWPYFGYYNNVNSYSLWTDNFDAQIERYNADYIIYHNRDGLEFSIDKLNQNKRLRIEKEIKGICNEQIYIYRRLY